MITSDFLEKIEFELAKYVPSFPCLEQNLIESMRYTLQSRGKRIRPFLLCEFCKISGRDPKDALPFACAVEMIHTYSLIHDDLPCMDNSVKRRGKNSNHVVFGENIALLSGDALLTLAFEIMTSTEVIENIGARIACKCVNTLSKRCGMFGMIGGQAIDVIRDKSWMKMQDFLLMNGKKTGELICAAAEIGCIIAGAPDFQIDAALKYASKIGVAFQIRDDIIDTSASEDSDKITFASFLGIRESWEAVERLVNEAISSLSSFKEDTQALKDFANNLKEKNGGV